MSGRLRFSIVTPSFNQAEWLPRTLESVLGQQGDFDLDYLVVDGGSTDGSVEILRRYGDRLRWLSEPDRGQSDAINKGLRRAAGDVVAWVNSDDLLLPGALQRVARAFAEHPAAQWLHGRCEIVDERDRPIRRWLAAYKDLRSRRYGRRALLVENFVSQMTVFWRRGLMERVGLLDEGLRYTMDYDLWLRFAAVADPLYLPEPLAAFRWHAGTKSGADFEEQFAEDWRVFLRHAPDDPWLRAHKRLRTWQITGVYRALRWLRRGGGRAGAGAPAP